MCYEPYIVIVFFLLRREPLFEFHSSIRSKKKTILKTGTTQGNPLHKKFILLKREKEKKKKKGLSPHYKKYKIKKKNPKFDKNN